MSEVITEFYERVYTLLPDSSIRRCMVLSTASYSAPEDRIALKWRLVVWLIWLLAGTAYREIYGLSEATAALPDDKFEWTLSR